MKSRTPKGRREARRARRRQDVVRPADIIADRFRRVTAEEDRPGIAHPVAQRLGIGGLDLEMLGRQPVDQRQRGLEGPAPG